MKKSMMLFLVTLIGIMLADRVLYSTLSFLDKKIYTGQGVGKMNTFLKQKDSVDILVFGSSRAGHHLKTPLFPQTSFNMGLDATRIEMASALISTLRRKEQLILVHIDPSTIFKHNLPDDSKVLINKLLTNREIASFFKEFHFKDYIITSIFNLNSYNGKVFSIFKNLLFPGDEYVSKKGYEPLIPDSNQIKIFKEMYESDNYDKQIEIETPIKVNDLSIRHIVNIQKIAQKNQSKVIFFTSPSLKGIDSDIEIQIEGIFEGFGITYWNDLNHFESYHQPYWKDFTHLSDLGASKYTEYFLNKLECSGFIK